MPGVQKQTAEHLMRLVAEHRLQVIPNRLRIFQRRFLARPFGQMPPAHFLRRLQLSELRRPKPQVPAELGLISLE
ncbi:hypothetical protein D3C87_2040540 [compost metagenome]